jgi:hypothetical protein
MKFETRTLEIGLALFLVISYLGMTPETGNYSSNILFLGEGALESGPQPTHQ